MLAEKEKISKEITAPATKCKSLVDPHAKVQVLLVSDDVARHVILVGAHISDTHTLRRPSAPFPLYPLMNNMSALTTI